MSSFLETQISPQHPPTATYDAIVVGAGPYGLSITAHLQGQGLNVATFGKPFQLWREQMPEGMLLRSYWWATNLSDPHKKYGLDQYFQETGKPPIDPLPAETLIEYGQWFQQRAVPNIDETYVRSIERKEQQFTLTLVDGRVLQSSVVILAPGLSYYTYRPADYYHLPSDVVSHTSAHYSFKPFAGKRVVIIGGGQSALETAALAHESGVDVQLVSRSPLVWIQGPAAFPEHRPLLERLRSPKAGIAPGWFNWQLEHFPYNFQHLPRSVKDRLLSGIASYGPMGAAWLKPRVIGQVDIHELQHVQQTKEVDDGVEVRLSNNKTLKADHIILATGYRANIRHLPMVHSSLLSKIRTYRNAPILNDRFESSVPGLYFVGFTSVLSCGPLFRFIVGTDATARRVASSVAWQVQSVRK